MPPEFAASNVCGALPPLTRVTVAPDAPLWMEKFTVSPSARRTMREER